MVEKKHLLYRIKETGGIIFWSALPPQSKSEKLLKKKMMLVQENLRESVSPTDVEFIRKELKDIRKINQRLNKPRKNKLNKVM